MPVFTLVLSVSLAVLGLPVPAIAQTERAHDSPIRDESERLGAVPRDQKSWRVLKPEDDFCIRLGLRKICHAGTSPVGPGFDVDHNGIVSRVVRHAPGVRLGDRVIAVEGRAVRGGDVRVVLIGRFGETLRVKLRRPEGGFRETRVRLWRDAVTECVSEVAFPMLSRLVIGDERAARRIDWASFSAVSVRYQIAANYPELPGLARARSVLRGATEVDRGWTTRPDAPTPDSGMHLHSHGSDFAAGATWVYVDTFIRDPIEPRHPHPMGRVQQVRIFVDCRRPDAPPILP